MKKIRFLSLTILMLLIINGCSQRQPRSVDHRVPSYSVPNKVPNSSQRLPSQQRAPQKSQQTLPQQSPVYGSNPARDRIVKIAKSVIGTPYKWGGNNPREGFDCSGLTSFVHKQAVGINIPRTTAKQRDNSRTISYAQLQPGDMLFFKTSKRTNHVGVYIGNRKFIHAPSRGKRVHISSMDSKYWHSRFVKFGSYL